MKFSLKWLKEFVNVNESPETLADKFNLMSTEVSSVNPLVEVNNLTIGHVKVCEDHPDADKLKVCQVDLGDTIKQIICGAPNVNTDQKVIVALPGAVLPGDFKIKKAKIRGVESDGMICSLDEIGLDHLYGHEDGIHVLPGDAPVGNDPLEYMDLNDDVIDLDLTPNRGDLLSMIGIAYDVKAMLSTQLHIEKPLVVETDDPNPVRVTSETGKCPAYHARLIRNVTLKESPYWLKARLIAGGIRPINNLVDITNYVMLEYGQPLHAFDADKLTDKNIIVRHAHENEVFVTLDDKERALRKTDIVVTDNNRPVALAGVMGGQNTEVTETTTSILLESAIFDPVSVRRTSSRLDLRSESSMRFEKRIDPLRTIEALDRAASLYHALADGEVNEGIASHDETDKTDTPIVISLPEVRSITGYPFKKSDLEEVFERLSFRFENKDGAFTVHAPTRRPDVETKQDLIEEIVRIFGYQAIPVSFPKTPTAGYLTDRQKTRRIIRRTLSDFGLDEVITYSLVSKKEATLFDEKEKTVIKVARPMSEDKSRLRHALLPSMLDVLSYNRARDIDDVLIFEIGSAYFKEKEEEHISGVLRGSYHETKWKGDTPPVDFYVTKGMIEALLEQVAVGDVDIRKPDVSLKNMHPGISAVIEINGDRLGYFGKLHPEFIEEQDIGDDVYVFDLVLDKILAYGEKLDEVEPISKTPAVNRDLAIVIDESITYRELRKTIETMSDLPLDRMEVFDVYTGDNVGDSKKSVALRFWFKRRDKTFSSEEIDRFMEKLIDKMKNSFDAVIRK